MIEEIKDESVPHYVVDRILGGMADTILNFYNDDVPLCLIGIMKGGLWTMYRLVDELRVRRDAPITLGHMGFSSYNEMMHASEMRCTYPLDLHSEELEGKHIWLIDDIYDSGKTMASAYKEVLLKEIKFSTLNIATLVTKNETSPEVFGFVVKKERFVVGCGMGLGERYRSLPYLKAFKNEEK